MIASPTTFSLAILGLLLVAAPPQATLEQAPNTVNSDAHGYFKMLVARADHVVSYSLRDPAQLATRANGGYAQSAARELWISYAPASDTYPRKQDAAKVRIPADGNSLRNQVRLPVKHGGEGFLVTWDAWWGEEFRFDHARIRNYKAFQLESGGGIWTEIRSRFQNAQRFPGALALVDVRAYGSSAERKGARVGGINYGGGSLAGQLHTFAIASNTWTRYWVQITPRAGSPWWDFSLWMADESRDPVKLFDNEAVKPKGQGWERLWLEYNTSTNVVKQDRGELVGYVRNVVVLKPLGDLSPILRRPSDRSGSASPTQTEAPSAARKTKNKNKPARP